jgi:hypothetical protein
MHVPPPRGDAPYKDAVGPQRRLEMDWLFVAVTIGTTGLGALVGYGLLNARLRRQAHETRLFLDYLTQCVESLKVEEAVDAMPVEWPAPFPTWGLDMECGIELVNTKGQVVGTARVPLPALN